jgi:dihydrofolate reductase
MQKEILEKLASEKSNPCVTISLNTHRTRPDNAQDRLLLKNLGKEAGERLLAQFTKRQITPLLEKLDKIADEIDVSHNLDSLHVFLSNQTKEIIRSTWPARVNSVKINDSFFLRPLIKAYNRSEEYLILLLSQSGTSLFEALNDGIVEEIRNEDFPFPENPHVITSRKELSDSKRADNMVREYLNKIDKAIVKVHNQTGMHCVVICTPENYTQLMQVADKPAVYHGFSNINYNDTANHTIAAQAWKIILEVQVQRKASAIAEMKAATSQGKVLTDVREIYRAVKEGRGELLITHQDFSQPASIKDEFTIELVRDPAQPGVIDDITSTIAWEVISRKGRVIFTDQDEIRELGKVALKTRY